jgi:hypothetical protein
MTYHGSSANAFVRFSLVISIPSHLLSFTFLTVSANCAIRICHIFLRSRPLTSSLQIEGRDEDEEDDEGEDIFLPDSIPWLGYSFPFSLDVNHGVSDMLRGELLSCLPEPTEAKELSDIYFQHAAWMFVIL